MSHGALRSCMIPGLAGEHSYPEGCLWKTKTTKYLQQYVNSIIYQKRKGWKLLWNIFLVKLNTAHSIFGRFCSFETTVRCPVLLQNAWTAPPSKYAVQCTPVLLSWLSYIVSKGAPLCYKKYFEIHASTSCIKRYATFLQKILQNLC